MSYRSIFIIVGLFGVVISAVGLWFATSLWFMWHQLPTSPMKVAFTTNAALERLVPWEALLPMNPDIGKAVYRIAVAYDKEPVALVLVPRVGKWRVVADSLQESGWRVRRQGLLLIAMREIQNFPTWQQASKQAAESIVLSRWPGSPELLATISDTPFFAQGEAFIVGNVWKKRLRLVATTNGTIPRQALLATEPMPPSQVALSAPGNLWPRIQGGSSDLWNEYLLDNLGFIKTHPAITTTFASAPSVQVIGSYTTEKPEVAVVATDATGAIREAMVGWVQEEERYHRLKQQAFRLPDGTLGYEKIPGDPLPVFGALGTDGCAPPLPERTTLWLCAKDAKAALGTNQAITQAAVGRAKTEDIAVTIDAGVMQYFQEQCPGVSASPMQKIWCQLQSLQLLIQGQALQGEFTFKGESL